MQSKFALLDFDVIKSRFNDIYQRILGNNRVDSIEKLPHPRREQLRVLLRTVDYLAENPTLTDQKKSMIYTAISEAVEFVARNNNYTSVSTFCDQLCYAVGKGPNISIPPAELAQYMKLTGWFLQQILCKEGSLNNGLKDKHIYSEGCTYKGFSFIELWNQVKKLEEKANIEAMKENEREQKKLKKLESATTQKPGLLSWMMGGHTMQPPTTPITIGIDNQDFTQNLHELSDENIGGHGHIDYSYSPGN